MLINIILNSISLVVIFSIIHYFFGPYITRKEFKAHKEDVGKFSKSCGQDIGELTAKLDSLAKELGYEYVSEAVKERQIIGNLERLGWEQIGEEKAVLRYSWKKIDTVKQKKAQETIDLVNKLKRKMTEDSKKISR